jgi:hypothetical protein
MLKGFGGFLTPLTPLSQHFKYLGGFLETPPLQENQDLDHYHFLDTLTLFFLSKSFNR